MKLLLLKGVAMSKHLRIKEAIDNAEANVLFLSGLPDKELSKRLDDIHIQMELADQKRNADSLELLEVWRTQIIDARIYKAENNIPDAINEIKLAVADIETFVSKTTIRDEALSVLQNNRTLKKQTELPNNEEQLKLF